MDPLEHVLAALGRRERALEDGDRRLQLAGHRIGAPERVGHVRSILLAASRELERGLEVLDRQSRVAAAKGDLAEARVGDGLLILVVRVREERAVDALGAVELVAAQGDLGREGPPAPLPRVRAGGEDVLGDAEAASQLA